jgi:hypothetical protein
MTTWRWLYTADPPYRWRFVARVILKTAALFVALNLLCVLLDPLPTLGKLSAYNRLFAGRPRLPYGENPAVAYNLSLFQLDAMFAAHQVARSPRPDEFRVLLIGDSSVWGILLRPEETLAGQLNAAGLVTAAGRRVRVYNLGYPTMSLTKDLLLLDYAQRYRPDLIVWLFTLESFDQRAQLDPALLQHNAGPVRRLIRTYGLAQRTDDPRFVALSWWDKTLFGRRRALADLLRLQLYGVPWAVTGIDQEYRTDYTPRAVDLPADRTWHGLSEDLFAPADLAFDVLRAGVTLAGRTPVLLVNEPMLISGGANSDIRYNAFYPRWAYDAYRLWLHQESKRQGWALLDLWDALPDAACYTDSAVHLTPACSARLAALLGPQIARLANGAAGEE